VSVTSWIPNFPTLLEVSSSPGAFSLFIIVNLSATFGAAVDADVGMFGCWVAGMWMLGWELNAGTGNW